ncbi:transcriptional regulator, Crp/Fnr family [Jatrophihabitans endophyticus]|uniref:Transcriptional regulator, Crp/Fnr family n=1 Tax=Jatrophihabitans endophyticus TaxID=1206085 RepID=A0A1M5PUG5_9ACTN|nr:Crp/Fnr family transcriptional regulator [Jatrophihabitans endophyticus]SHH05312.1 transcriptional regulator, Crp/Fnr family [Jatrophihabitans endophyticus]
MARSSARPVAADPARFAEFCAATAFRGLPPSRLAALFDRSRYWQAGRRQQLFTAGSQGDDMFVVLAGKVALTYEHRGAQATMVEVMTRGDHFGESGALIGGRRLLTASVLSDRAELVMLPGTPLRAWLAEHPDAALNLLGCLARRVRNVTVTTTDTALLTLPSRLAKQLLQLAERFGTDTARGIVIDHELTQWELAQLTGSTRETVNKALRHFETRGWIRTDVRSVTVLDSDALARRSH